jgi:hypothetical protein
LGLVAGVAAVLALREATLSTHDERIDPDSRVEVVFDAEARHREQGQTLEELAEALVITCRLEISSDPVGEVERVSDPDADADRFRVVLSPALDQTNEKQFRGCMEDWVIDQVHADVLTITEIPP